MNGLGLIHSALKRFELDQVDDSFSPPENLKAAMAQLEEFRSRSLNLDLLTLLEGHPTLRQLVWTPHVGDTSSGFGSLCQLLLTCPRLSALIIETPRITFARQRLLEGEALLAEWRTC